MTRFLPGRSVNSHSETPGKIATSHGIWRPVTTGVTCTAKLPFCPAPLGTSWQEVGAIAGALVCDGDVLL